MCPAQRALTLSRSRTTHLYCTWQSSRRTKVSTIVSVLTLAMPFLISRQGPNGRRTTTFQRPLSLTSTTQVLCSRRTSIYLCRTRHRSTQRWQPACSSGMFSLCPAGFATSVPTAATIATARVSVKTARLSMWKFGSKIKFTTPFSWLTLAVSSRPWLGASYTQSRPS